MNINRAYKKSNTGQTPVTASMTKNFVLFRIFYLYLYRIFILFISTSKMSDNK